MWCVYVHVNRNNVLVRRAIINRFLFPTLDWYSSKTTSLAYRPLIEWQR